MSSEEITNPKPAGRPWVGAVLSFFAPGAGCFRAGLWKRGSIWALLFLLAPIWWMGLLGLDGPNWLFLLLFAIYPILFIWMLNDNARNGKTSGKVWGIVVIILVVKFLYPKDFWLSRPFNHPTGSMEPTIQGHLRTLDSMGFPDRDAKPLTEADQIIVSHLYYRFHSIQRGDLIAFDTSGIRGIGGPHIKTSPMYVKRVVGLPGETIRIENGDIYADDRKLGEEDGIPPITYEPGRIVDRSWTIPEGRLFVLGDNSSNSYDSRGWGFLPKENVIGKVTRIYYPLHRFRRPFYDSKEALERKKQWEALEDKSIAR